MHLDMSRSLSRFNSCLSAAAALLFIFCTSITCAQENAAKKELPEEADSKVSLINKEFPGESWTFFSGKKDSKVSDTWRYISETQLDGPYISCSGHPYGYIRTRKQYRDFEFGLEWRFPKDENGNSGVLLFTTGDNRIWPTSLQVQLQQPFAGSAFPSGGAKSSNELRNVPMLSRPVNQWNRCHITCRNGKVTIIINDQEVGTVTECQPLEGAISLQSEGSEIHFRNIWIRELPVNEPAISKARLRKSKRTFTSARRKVLFLEN